MTAWRCSTVRLLSRAVGGRPVRVSFSADGRTVAAALSAAREVAFVSVAPDAPPGAGAGGSIDVRRVTVGGMPDGLLFAGAGGRWYVSDLTAPRLSIVDPVRGRVDAVYTFEGSSAGAIVQLAYGGRVGGLVCQVVRNPGP